MQENDIKPEITLWAVSSVGYPPKANRILAGSTSMRSFGRGAPRCIGEVRDMKSDVYFLKLDNDQYYIGSTTNIDRRISEHQKGMTKSTRHRRPVRLVFKQTFDNIRQAKIIEYRLKKLKSRKIIERIIENGFINLQLLGL